MKYTFFRVFMSECGGIFKNENVSKYVLLQSLEGVDFSFDKEGNLKSFGWVVNIIFNGGVMSVVCWC